MRLVTFASAAAALAIGGAAHAEGYANTQTQAQAQARTETATRLAPVETTTAAEIEAQTNAPRIDDIIIVPGSPMRPQRPSPLPSSGSTYTGRSAMGVGVTVGLLPSATGHPSFTQP